jgi:hypothetical protein
MASVKTFTQTVDETLDYDFDFEDWLRTDTITASAVESTPSGLTATTTFTDTVGKVWCLGGENGTTYDVTLTINTFSGRTKEKCFHLKIISDPCD